MTKWRTWLYLVAFSTVLIASGCTPSETEMQSQTMTVPMKGNKIDVEKVQAYIDAQNTKISELNEQLTIAYQSVDKAKSESSEMKQLADEKATEANNMKEELEYYKSYVKETTSLLPANQLQKLINKEWSYSATINGISLPANGVLEIRESSFSIDFVEERTKFSVLPESDSLKGKIPSSLESSVRISGSTPTSTTADTKTTLTYSFNNLEVGNKIVVELEDALAKKLKLSTHTITISVVK